MNRWLALSVVGAVLGLVISGWLGHRSLSHLQARVSSLEAGTRSVAIAASLAPVAAIKPPDVARISPRIDALRSRLDATERRLRIAMTTLESTLPTTHARHDRNRKQLTQDLARLREDVRALAARERNAVETGAAPPAPPVEADAQPAAPPAEEPEPPVQVEGDETVRRSDLVQTLREETIDLGVREFASMVGLDDDEAADLGAVVRERREHHLDVVRSVIRGDTSVADAAMSIHEADRKARKAIDKMLTHDQVTRLNGTLSKLEDLWWRM